METRSSSEHECDRFALLIDDLVDGTIDDAARAELEAHLAGCEACRALARDLDDMRRVSRGLPVRSPRSSAWPQIAEVLAAEARAPGHAIRRSWTSARVLLPLAAGLVLAVGASLVYVAWPGGAVAPGGSGAAVHGPSADLVRSVDQELRLAESHYENAIAGLEKIAKDEESSLDPALASTLQKSLGIIDQAIQESRQALSDQPESTMARDSLFEAFRKKVSLLEDTIALINVMRKGDQAGTARVVKGLSKS